MTLTINPVNQLKGECRVPGDKSISHRALILSSLACGKSKIQGLLEGEDCLHTMKAMQRLGVQIDRQGPGDYTVRGEGLQGLQEPEDILDCGNSGTCFRLLGGLLAGNNFYSVLTGDDSLRGRPMDRIIKPLTEMGARIWARQQKYAPLSFRGHHLRGIEYNLPVASAQVKSCLLLAGLYAGEKVVLTEPGPSRDHTERMLKKSGIKLEIEGRTITLRANSSRDLSPFSLEIPGDISSAAYLIAAALITDNSEMLIRNVGINPTRSGFLEVVRDMGGKIEYLNQQQSGGEPVADILVKSSQLQGTDIRGEIIPRLIDEIPIIAVLAASAEGETVIRDARELRVKETDRIQALASQLPALGVNIKPLEDGLIIEGPTAITGGCKLRSFGDHRIAMSLAIAGLRAGGPVQISGEESIKTSYPGFMDTLHQLSI